MAKILGLLVALALVFFIFKWNLATNKIQNLCNDISINNDILTIKKALNDSRLLQYSDANIKGKNVLSIHSGANFGRHTCSIEYSDGKVVKIDKSFLN